MNFIAGVMLLFLEEESVFWLLTALIENILPPDYYAHVRERTATGRERTCITPTCDGDKSEREHLQRPRARREQ